MCVQNHDSKAILREKIILVNANKIQSIKNQFESNKKKRVRFFSFCFADENDGHQKQRCKYVNCVIAHSPAVIINKNKNEWFKQQVEIYHIFILTSILNCAFLSVYCCCRFISFTWNRMDGNLELLEIVNVNRL